MSNVKRINIDTEEVFARLIEITNKSAEMSISLELLQGECSNEDSGLYVPPQHILVNQYDAIRIRDALNNWLEKRTELTGPTND
jgi:hypothetical protein